MNERTEPTGSFTTRQGALRRDGLTGKRVVVTRAPHQAAELVDLLRSRGAIPLHYPCIEIVPPADTAQLDAALEAAADGYFEWLVVTSANTVLVLRERLDALGITINRAAIAAVGPRTATAVEEELGLPVQVIAEEHTAEGLAAALGELAGVRLLLPQSAIARPVLANSLQEAGAQVTAVDAYRTVVGHGGDDVVNMLDANQIDAITFTSSSTARNFLKRLAEEEGDIRTLSNVCLAAIGSITANTIEELGLAVNVMPNTFTLESMVEALEEYFQREKK